MSTLNDMDWKERQRVSYQNHNNDFGDNNLTVRFEWLKEDDLVEQVVDFFRNGSELVYPAKYIFVNIVYSHFLEKYFDRDFYESLDDAEMIADSPCVVTYSQCKNVYDRVLEEIGDIEQYPSIQTTYDYFKEEFLFDDEFDESLWEFLEDE